MIAGRRGGEVRARGRPVVASSAVFDFLEMSVSGSTYSSPGEQPVPEATRLLTRIDEKYAIYYQWML